MGRWKIVVPADRLAEFQNDEGFAELLVLTRMANALRFALSAAFDAQTGTVGERQRNSSFLLTAASLSEILRSLPRMGKHFRSLPAFKKLISPLLADKSVSDLRGKVLSWLRNKAVFHHDKDVVPIGLAGLHPGPWTFAEGDSEAFVDVAYPMADFTIIRAALEQIGTDGNLVDAFEQVLSQTLQIATSLIAAVDSLVGQALNERGLTFDEGT